MASSIRLPRLFLALIIAIILPIALLPTRILGAEVDEALLERVRLNLRDTKQDVQRIIHQVLNGSAKHEAWNRLALFTDTFGSRLCGSNQYDLAAEWMIQQLQADGLENVHGETAMVPQWYRGEEYAYLLQPRYYKINILGLGTSIGTPNTTAEMLVVQSFDELQKQGAAGNTTGKIVVFNQQCDWESQPIDCYGLTANYRVTGASEAAKVGAVAVLVRSLTGQSIASPHTGVQDYEDGVVQIPAACITVEDAEMFQRMQDRGQKLVASLVMGAQNYPDAPSLNVIAEIPGSKYPDQVVLVSGHLDSWDVGQGAMDDGGGAFISWEVLSLLRQLNLQPLRTIRFVGWSCEEFGGIGAEQYYEDHKSNVSNYDLVMESDLGVFKAQGIQFTGNTQATAIMTEILQLLAPINATQLVPGGDGTDIAPWMGAGVPGASLLNENDRYFWFHHSNGDTMTVLDPDDMDTAVITWAATAYAVANLDDMLPRNSSSINERFEIKKMSTKWLA